MKAAFLFNVTFSEYEGHYYSTNLTQTVWNERYLKYFDEIVVIGYYVKSKNDPTGKRVRSDNERVHFKCLPDCSAAKKLLNRAQTEKFIAEAIRDCDCAISRGVWGANFCKKLHKPCVIEAVTDPLVAYWYYSIVGKLVALPIFFQTRKVIRNSEHVLYVTQKYLQKRYPTNGVSVGVSDVELTLGDSAAILEKRRDKIKGKSEAEPVVLGTAAAVSVAYKGQKYVIEALSILKKRGHTGYVYRLAGGGSQKKLSRCAEKYGVADQVEFLGSVPHDKMSDWYDGLDIYVHPSKMEGLPRALAEAISRALPCIGFRVGGIPELLDESSVLKKGFGKAKRIADKLEEYTDKETLLALAEKNVMHSQEYRAEILNEKRDQFYIAFKKSVQNKQNESIQE